MPDRLAQLEAMLKARKGKPGFGENVAAIEAEIARLKAEAEAEPEPDEDTEEPQDGV